MNVGDRVMVKSGRHGGMVGTLTRVREKKVRTGKQGVENCFIEKPVGTVKFTSTNRKIDEVISNLTEVPVYPFA